LFLYALVGEPLIGMRIYRSLIHRSGSEPGARKEYYLRLLASEWGWVAVMAIIGISLPAPFLAFGLRPPDIPAWVLSFTILVAMLFLQFTLVRSQASNGTFHERVQPAGEVLPDALRERWLFAAVALTAGICEELLYRGFLWFYLSTWLPGLPLWAIFLVTSLIYGLSRAYQNLWGVLQGGLAGAILAFLFWFSGTLLPAMIFHTLIDLRFIFTRPMKTAGNV
jgi:membrane protease YdiL (CAAX protease family)